MTCPRCKGLALLEVDTVETIVIAFHRCLNCGYLHEIDHIPAGHSYSENGRRTRYGTSSRRDVGNYSADIEGEA